MQKAPAPRPRARRRSVAVPPLMKRFRGSTAAPPGPRPSSVQTLRAKAAIPSEGKPRLPKMAPVRGRVTGKAPSAEPAFASPESLSASRAVWRTQ